MRILIDEDTAVQLIEPLRHVLIGHEVAHVSGISWKGKKDRHVLPDAKNAGYQVLITKDALSSATLVNATRSRNPGCTASVTSSASAEHGASPWPWARSSRLCPWSCRNWRTPMASAS